MKIHSYYTHWLPPGLAGDAAVSQQDSGVQNKASPSDHDWLKLFCLTNLKMCFYVVSSFLSLSLSLSFFFFFGGKWWFEVMLGFLSRFQVATVAERVLIWYTDECWVFQMSKRTNTTATARLRQDYMRIKKDPVPYITAEPLSSNILEW